MRSTLSFLKHLLKFFDEEKKEVVQEKPKEILVPVEVLSTKKLTSPILISYIENRKGTKNFFYSSPYDHAVDFVLIGDKFRNSDLNESLRWYSESIKICPTAIAYCRRSFVYCLQNKNTLAYEDAESACLLDSNYWIAHNNMGVCKLKERDFEQAIRHFKQALTLDKNDQVYFNLAVAQESSGDWLSAIKNYETTVKLNPTNEQAINSFYKLKGMVN